MQLDITPIWQAAMNPATIRNLCGIPVDGSLSKRYAWALANRLAHQHFSDTAEALAPRLRLYFAGFGAWNAAELAAHTPHELCAMLLQDVANTALDVDLSNVATADDWAAYHAGDKVSNLYLGDDARVYVYLGT